MLLLVLLALGLYPVLALAPVSSRTPRRRPAALREEYQGAISDDWQTHHPPCRARRAGGERRYCTGAKRSADLVHLQRRSQGAEIFARDRDHARQCRQAPERPGKVHTGDVSDGSGKLPISVWSATPLFVNDTVYVGTPFYRIFALEPDTGKVKWVFDTHAELKALTQPDLKNRGVAYWQADDRRSRAALPEDRLYRHHGRQALCGRRRHRQALRRLRR